MSDGSRDARLPVEIERKYLLDALPALPPDAIAWRIEQGYLAGGSGRTGGAPGSEHDAASENPVEGRVRRARGPGGEVVCTHTIKSGTGLVRTERERRITEEVFESAWLATRGRRLGKTRWVVRAGRTGLVWEIDVFDDLPLVLAEVELPAADTPVQIPSWLAPHVVREVTGETAYGNDALATRASARA